MSTNNACKPKHSKQVWTPLKKPPHPGTVHILSDDALLVLAALREAHWKKIEDQQRRCKKTTDVRSYYTQIYAQSFKTERVDTGTEQTSSLTKTNILPGPGTNQVDTSQPHPTSFDSGSGSTWMNPTLPVEAVSVVKTEPERETLSCNRTQNPFQLQRLPDQVQIESEVNEVHQQETKVDNDFTITSRPEPSRSAAFRSNLNLPSTSRSVHMPPLPTVIGNTSQGLGSIPSTNTHHLQVPRPATPEYIEELKDHAILPTSRTAPSLQNSMGEASEICSKDCPLLVPRLSSTEDVEELDNHTISSISKTVPSLQNITVTTSSSRHISQGSGPLPRTCPVPVSRCLSSAEDVEELDDHTITSISKTVPSLQIVTGITRRPLSRGSSSSRALLRTCAVPVSRCLSSAEDVEGLNDHTALQDRPGGFSMAPGIDTINTVDVGPAVDVNQLSTKAGSVSSNQALRISKLHKRGNACISSKTSNDASIAVKKRVVPTFHAKISGLKDKSKSKTEALTQMSLEKVMGVDRSRVAPTSTKSITSMSPSDLTKLREIISEAGEMLMMLMYTDGSTQLRELDELTKAGKRSSASLHQDGIANSVLVAIQHKAAKKEYTFISFPLAGLGKENASAETRNVLLQILESNTRKVCFDAQEMMHAIIINYRLDPQSGCSKRLIMDPKIACWLLDPDNPPVTFSEMLKTFLAGKYNLTPSNQMGYQVPHKKDLTLLGTVMADLTNRLQKKGLWELFISLEVPLIPILAGMEVQGIQVNQKMLISYSNILKNEIKKIETQCYKEAGHPFQITSHIQLRQVLFNELKLDEQCPGQKLARTNVQNLKSTSETVLHKLKDLHPLPELVLNYRQLVKLKSTYIDGLADYVSGGYIHTSWEQTSASSGRLQSANPNIQNIPKQPLHLHEDTQGAGTDDTNASTTPATTLWMREPFFAHDGWSFVAADFQSIELRILAHLSQDAVLLKVFNDAGSTDIFVQLTCEWLGLNPEDVKTTDRERTKRIVYSVIYGVGAERLAETLNDTKENAKAFTKSFLGKFKGVNTFAHRCISECQRHGHVNTIFHRHRLISNITSQNFHVRSHAERQAVNFVIQGSAADICKLSMIRIMKVLSEKAHLRARLLVQIHDELLFEVHDDDINEVKGLLKCVMESTPILGESICRLKVPLPVSLSSGKTWGHLQQA